jgi:hypothetical protein
MRLTTEEWAFFHGDCEGVYGPEISHRIRASKILSAANEYLHSSLKRGTKMIDLLDTLKQGETMQQAVLLQHDPEHLPRGASAGQYFKLKLLKEPDSDDFFLHDMALSGGKRSKMDVVLSEVLLPPMVKGGSLVDFVQGEHVLAPRSHASNSKKAHSVYYSAEVLEVIRSKKMVLVRFDLQEEDEEPFKDEVAANSLLREMTPEEDVDDVIAELAEMAQQAISESNEESDEESERGDGMEVDQPDSGPANVSSRRPPPPPPLQRGNPPTGDSATPQPFHATRGKRRAAPGSIELLAASEEDGDRSTTKKKKKKSKKKKKQKLSLTPDRKKN